MAVLHSRAGVVVIKVVYDGPPLAGKTSSVEALGRSLSRPVYSPETVQGRTVYFDWLDYVGGLFEGYQIRCHIVSVPGQNALASRRRRLVADADAVVFVADSTASELDRSIDALRVLHARLESTEGPPVGIVFQANKRDAKNAVPMAELREQLAEFRHLGVVETVATDGTGIRQAFVFAVRLALDRVRELIRTGSLREGEPEVASGAELLRHIKQEESSTAHAEREFGFSFALPQRRTSAPPPSSEGEPIREFGPTDVCLPDREVPGGMIWPPVDGRILLHEIANLRAHPLPTADGGYEAREGAWWFATAPGSHHLDVDAGKRELLAWARLHTMQTEVLSPRRCIVLVEGPRGDVRLWQVIHREETLGDAIRRLFAKGTTEVFGLTLIELAQRLVVADEVFHGDGWSLPASVSNVGIRISRPQFVGLAPTVEAQSRRHERVSTVQLVRREFESLLAECLARSSVDVPAVLGQLEEIGRRRAVLAPLTETLAAMLLGH